MRRYLWTLTLIIFIFLAFISLQDNKKAEYSFHPVLMTGIHVKDVPEKFKLNPIEDASTDAKAAVVINAVTGDVLFEKNSTKSLPIASMSKIMSELIVLEAIEKGEISWDDEVPISDYAYAISHHPGFASVFLNQDVSYTVEQLFYAMAIQSANGATIALAEKVAGSEREFVKRMNQKAVELGLEATSFVNSTGLTNKDLLGNHPVGTKEDMNKMSALDLAELSMHVIHTYPELLEITKLGEFMLHDYRFLNTNWMLPANEELYKGENVTYPTIDGLKTGYTEAAGYSFTGTAEINDIRVISVVLGLEKVQDRFLETKKFYKLIEDQLKN